MRLWLAFTALSLSACSLAPDAVIPDASVPASWRGAARADTQEPSASVRFEDFGNEELRTLIAKAIAHNTDLAQALARIEQARASTYIAGSGLYPAIDASGSARRTRSESNSSTVYDSSANAGLTVSYELDLWQKNRNMLDASLWDMRATQYDRDALALTVSSEVSRLYSGVLSFDERIRVAGQNLTNAREILRITELRMREGAISGLELAQQRTSVANTEASIASLANQRDLFFNQLAQLSGVAPSGLTLDSKSTLAGMTLAAVPVSHPWELLERRPDIAASEARLRSTHIDIGVARANALPNLSLSLDGTVGASPSSTVVGLASSFFAPIFHGGALEAEIDRSKAARDEQSAAYEGVLLTAFREVEDALSTYDAATSRRASYERGATEARNAYRIARARFDAGSIDFTTLLDTQASLLQSEDSLVGAIQDQLAAAIDLTRALGGGWKRDTSADPAS